jgi:hypothetical protein
MSPQPMLTGVLLRAVDAASGQALSATFFVNGVQQSASFTLPIGTACVVQAQCAGYNSASTNFTVSGNSAAGITIPMSPAASGVTIQVQFNPPAAGIQWYLDGGSPAATNASGISQMPNVQPGNHILQTPDTANFAAVAQTIAVGSCRSFTITLVSKNASGSIPNAANKNTVYDPATDPLNMPGLVQDVSEDTYDNTAYQGYFTSAQARLYIGNLFIDQMQTLQFALQQNNVPVFGYCSEFVDAYARGRSLVQGQLVLNYVHQGYLYAALKQYAKLSNPSTTGNAADVGTQVAAVVQKSQTLSVQSPTAANQALTALAAQKLSDLLSASTPADIQKAQALLRAGNAPYNPYANPLYAHQVFDLRLEIGDGEQLTVRLLEGVKLGANEQILDQSGQVIGEAYGFTARRLR